MKVFLFFVFFISIPFSSASPTLTLDNCERFSLQSCEELINLGLTLEEEQEFLLTTLAGRSLGENFEFIRQWNEEIEMIEPPNGTQIQNHNSISNAWLEIIAVMPTISLNNILYNNESGEVLIRYNYELSLPNNFYHDNYPTDSICGHPGSTNNEGNCKVIHSSQTDQSHVNTYHNGNDISNSSIAYFNHSFSVNNFTTKLNIRNNIGRDKYEWKGGNCCILDCNKYGCVCQAWWYNCELVSADSYTDSLLLQDWVETINETIGINSSNLGVDNNGKKASITIMPDNLYQYNLLIDDSNLTVRNYRIDYNTSFDPYYVLTLTPLNDLNILNDMMLEDIDNSNNTHYITYHAPIMPTNCNIEVSGFFQEQSSNCTISSMKETDITISTDKEYYLRNESINIQITFSTEDELDNGTIFLEYGSSKENISVEGTQNITLDPEAPTLHIIASFDGDETRQSSSAYKLIRTHYGYSNSLYVYVIYFTLICLAFILVLAKIGGGLGEK